MKFRLLIGLLLCLPLVAQQYSVQYNSTSKRIVAPTNILGMTFGNQLITNFVGTGLQNSLGNLTVSSTLSRFNGIGSGVAGDVIFRDVTGWTNLAKGVDGEVLKLVGGYPSWETDSTGGGGDDIWINHGDVTTLNLTNAAAAEITWSNTGTNWYPLLSSAVTRDSEVTTWITVSTNYVPSLSLGGFAGQDGKLTNSLLMSAMTASRLAVFNGSSYLTNSTLTEANILTEAEAALAYQPLDADLTRLATITSASGDVIYRDATGWTNLAKGIDGKVLKLTGGFPSWETDSTGVGATGDDVWVNHQDVTNPNFTNHVNAEITWGVSGTNVYPELASTVTRDVEVATWITVSTNLVPSLSLVSFAGQDGKLTNSFLLSAMTASRLAVFDGSKYLTNSTLTEASITDNLTEAEASALYEATNNAAINRIKNLPTTANLLMQTDGTGITNKAVGGDLTFSGGNFTIAADSVALTTDTTGDYVATAAGTAAEVEVSGAGTEGRAITIGLPDDLVLGDASFTAITNSGELFLGTTNLLAFVQSHLTEAEAYSLYQGTNNALTRVVGMGTTANHIVIMDGTGITNKAVTGDVSLNAGAFTLASDLALGDASFTAITNSALTPNQFVSAAADKSLTSAAVASSILAASLTDETGTGSAVFSNLPTFSQGATAGGGAYFTEDSDNGTSKITLKSADALSADYTVTLPSATGTLGLNAKVREIWIPANAMNAPASGAPQFWTNTWATTTDAQAVEVYRFDSASDEQLQFTLTLPGLWNGSDPKAKIFWKQQTASAATNVWGIVGGSLADEDTGGNTLGTAATLEVVALNDTNKVDITAAITVDIGSTPTAGDLIWFKVYRDADATEDNMADDAYLIGIMLQYTELATEPTAW